MVCRVARAQGGSTVPVTPPDDGFGPRALPPSSIVARPRDRQPSRAGGTHPGDRGGARGARLAGSRARAGAGRRAPTGSRRSIPSPTSSRSARSVSRAAACSTSTPSPGSASFEAALHSAGGATRAVDALFGGEAELAFCGLRPPGHHAEQSRAMGFCIFNNVAVAAQHALDAHGAERVLVLDWDVHHGNGTNDIFHGTSEVLYASLHQSPLYPGTGALSDNGSGAGEGYTLNLPVPPGSGHDEWLSLVQHVVVPVARSYRPRLVLVSAGFDAHRDDPLANCELTEESYAAMTATVRELARELDAPLAFTLEGGYDLRALSSSVVAVLESALEQREAAPSVPIEPLAATAREHYARWWPELCRADRSGPRRRRAHAPPCGRSRRGPLAGGRRCADRSREVGAQQLVPSAPTSNGAQSVPVEAAQHERRDPDRRGQHGDVAGERLEHREPEALAVRRDEHGVRRVDPERHVCRAAPRAARAARRRGSAPPARARGRGASPVWPGRRGTGCRSGLGRARAVTAHAARSSGSKRSRSIPQGSTATAPAAARAGHRCPRKRRRDGRRQARSAAPARARAARPPDGAGRCRGR